MKALTISQPWAELIASGEKWVENRTWKAPESAFGKPLAIHAGSGTQYLTKKELQGYTTGAIVATCILVVCVDLENRTWKDDELLDKYGITWGRVCFHDYCEGPIAWVLTEIRRCAEPYPINGKQGLWEFDASLAVDELAF